jgi:hypothetical protein
VEPLESVLYSFITYAADKRDLKNQDFLHQAGVKYLRLEPLREQRETILANYLIKKMISSLNNSVAGTRSNTPQLLGLSIDHRRPSSTQPGCITIPESKLLKCASMPTPDTEGAAHRPSSGNIIKIHPARGTAAKYPAPTSNRPVVYIKGVGAKLLNDSLNSAGNSFNITKTPPSPLNFSQGSNFPSNSTSTSHGSKESIVVVAPVQEVMKKYKARRSFRVVLRRKPTMEFHHTPPLPAAADVQTQETIEPEYELDIAREPSVTSSRQSFSSDAKKVTKRVEPLRKGPKREGKEEQYVVGKPPVVNALKEMAERLIEIKQKSVVYPSWRLAKAAKSRRQAELRRKKVENMRIELRSCD